MSAVTGACRASVSLNGTLAQIAVLMEISTWAHTGCQYVAVFGKMGFVCYYDSIIAKYPRMLHWFFTTPPCGISDWIYARSNNQMGNKITIY